MTQLNSPAVIREMRIAITYFCNMHCQHCYVPEGNRLNYGQLLQPDEAPVETILSFIDLLVRDLGLQRISITGGEPLLQVVWPRTRQVLAYALSRGVDVRLITNGAGQIDICDVAAHANGTGKLVLQVSLDGVCEDKVDKFRGHSGALQSALDTIRNAVQAGLPVQARYTITEDNYDETEACYDLVTELGATAFIVKPMFATGTGRVNRHLLIGPNPVRELQLRLAVMSVGRKTRLKLPQPCYIGPEDLPPNANVEVMYCFCGKEVAHLTPQGDVYPCTYMVGLPKSEDWILGNIQDKNFNLARSWAAPTTYIPFRHAKKEGVCPAQELMYISA